MTRTAPRTLKAAGKHRAVNVTRDTPDLRDRWYDPTLIPLQPSIDNRQHARIRDQGEDGACTGFGLAAVIDLLNRKHRDPGFAASTRMLYEMAKQHDEWRGTRYEGSSCRGAIRGWMNMGVCTETEWPYVSKPKAGDLLTIDRARSARNNPLGAYYRLRPTVNDYHAALNEVEAIYVSASVHEGWSEPVAGKKDSLAVIRPSDTVTGGHAFCLVGYNERGFIVQNSWGKDWGSKGFALWLYEDWLANIDDGWVLRLGVPTPQIFGLTSRTASTRSNSLLKPAPRRMEIAGHFVHFDDGKLASGDYWSSMEDLQQTAGLIRDARGKYRHLLLYAHGGLNSPQDCARRCAALKEGYKRNGVYPLHLMYDTGLAEELKDTLLRGIRDQRAQSLLQDIGEAVTEKTDTLLETLLRKPVTPIWDEMKRDAKAPFVSDTTALPAGADVIQRFARTLGDSGLQIHLVGHSTGAVLIGHLLQALDSLGLPDLVASCSLMAPACSIDFYQTHYAPRLDRHCSGTRLPVLDLYTLSDQRERDDNVAGIYRKSLLYLVSRAFEREQDKPLLGMQKFAERLPGKKALTIHCADGKSKVTKSESHGGFDNDVATMNTILARIIGGKPAQPFLASELTGY